MKKYFYAVFLPIIVLLVGGYYYLVFPAINIHEESFWGGAFIIALILAVISAFRQIKDKVFYNQKKSFADYKKLPNLTKVFLFAAIIIVIVYVFGGLSGCTFFRAKKYASLLKVKKAEFSKDINETSQVTDIALMDTESARKFGNRKIGSLSDVVSQYEVEDDYTQISINKLPMKVSSLKYASFFKWLNNKDKGIPGYVKVNPVNSNAEYVSLKKGMKYVPSAYFNYNLQRHVQLNYPTKIIAGYHFEIDDQGNPYYICPTVTAKIGLFGAKDVAGAVICDPVSGKCQYYTVDKIPTWVDCVYAGRLLEKKYNWHGLLSDGFWNSKIGQTGCKQTTDDFGYKIIDDDVWIYTGITSVTGDQSNIGFVMMNQRTSEAKYYSVSGAEEHSAMDSAEGEVQEKGYKASFPSLINVAGTPTYIMVLKDAAGLVKMYAMVNVEQYNIVATAVSQNEVFSKYKKMLLSKGKKVGNAELQKKQIIEVKTIQFINTEDGTMVYIKDTNNIVYKQAFKDNESLIKLNEGDKIEVEYDSMENGINLLTSFKNQ